VEEQEILKCGHYWEECSTEFFGMAETFLDLNL
jgi:hypothetical protein